MNGIGQSADVRHIRRCRQTFLDATILFVFRLWQTINIEETERIGKRDDVMKCPPFKVVLTLQGRIATASEISIIGDDKNLRPELSSQVFDTFGACVS